MFVIRNRANGMKMDERLSLETAMEYATELANEHQQVYEICELTVRSTIYPTPEQASLPNGSELGSGIQLDKSE